MIKTRINYYILLLFIVGLSIGYLANNIYLLSFFSILVIFVFSIICSIYFPVYTNIILLTLWFCCKFLLINIKIGGFSLSQLSMIILIPPLIIGIFVRRKYILKVNKMDKCLIIYVFMTIYCILGVLTTEVKTDAIISYLKLFIGMLLFVFYSKCMIKNKEREFLKKNLIIIGIFSSVITLIGVYAGMVMNQGEFFGLEVAILYYGGVYRPTGIAGGPVANGILLYLIIMFVRSIKVQSNLKIYNVLEIFFVISLILSLTRTVILAIIFAYIFELLIFNFKFRNIIKIVVTCTILLFIYLLILPESFNDIIQARFVDFNSGDINDFGAGRFGIWIGILTGIIHNFNLINFFIGYGIDMAPLFVAQYSVFGHTDATHNDFLDQFITNGFFGLLMLIMFYINILFEIFNFKNKTLSKRLLSWIICYYIIILNLSNTNYSADQRWLFLIIIIIFLQENHLLKNTKKRIAYDK